MLTSKLNIFYSRSHTTRYGSCSIPSLARATSRTIASPRSRSRSALSFDLHTVLPRSSKRSATPPLCLHSSPRNDLLRRAPRFEALVLSRSYFPARFRARTEKDVLLSCVIMLQPSLRSYAPTPHLVTHVRAHIPLALYVCPPYLSYFTRSPYFLLPPAPVRSHPHHLPCPLRRQAADDRRARRHPRMATSKVRGTIFAAIRDSVLHSCLKKTRRVRKKAAQRMCKRRRAGCLRSGCAPSHPVETHLLSSKRKFFLDNVGAGVAWTACSSSSCRLDSNTRVLF